VTDNLATWRVETLRLTLFTETPIDITNLQWWENIADTQAEARVIQPKLGRLQVAGPVKGGVCSLALDCQPQRIDWLLTPQFLEGQEVSSFPTFAPLPEAVAIYRDLLLPWLHDAPVTVRVAFGAVLTREVAGRKQGYEALAAFLPGIQLDSDNSSDFSYQINRPRASVSGIDALRINRLSKWSVVKLSGLVIEVTAGQPTARVFAPTGDVYGCRVEMDINSAPEYRSQIPHDMLVTLLEELISLGLEIARMGDIP